ncbi:DUF4157 domain-containing protein [Tateyamaria armeniaca]|uniref:DUF4157 domain-containing protein n=1 Tax=Tateyamaria armeniaca TaxID=2518930 RepID=A0ABW8UQ72_9RHOB
MANDKIKKIVDKVKGKKAKVKPIKTEPEGTKASKLPPDVVEALETEFGADLKKARVHVGGNAGDICKELGAKAFAMGPNIYMAKPGDAKNKELLAHELTHVIQQAGGKKLPKEQKGKVLVSK